MISLIALASQGLQHSEQVWPKLTGKSGIQTGKEGQCHQHRHLDFYIVIDIIREESTSTSTRLAKQFFIKAPSSTQQGIRRMIETHATKMTFKFSGSVSSFWRKATNWLVFSRPLESHQRLCQKCALIRPGRPMKTNKKLYRTLGQKPNIGFFVVCISLLSRGNKEVIYDEDIRDDSRCSNQAAEDEEGFASVNCLPHRHANLRIGLFYLIALCVFDFFDEMEHFEFRMSNMSCGQWYGPVPLGSVPAVEPRQGRQGSGEGRRWPSQSASL